jgi:hypothetical protein
MEAVFLLAFNYGACLFSFFVVSLFSFPAERVSSYWFVVLALVVCLRRGASGGALLIWFSLVLDLCVLARIHATHPSLWWLPTSFGPVVTRVGRAVLPCLVHGQHAL